MPTKPMCNLRSVWVALKRAGVLEETIIVVSTPPPRYGTSHSCMPAYQWTQTTGATCVRQDATNNEAMSSLVPTICLKLHLMAFH